MLELTYRETLTSSWWANKRSPSLRTGPYVQSPAQLPLVELLSTTCLDTMNWEELWPLKSPSILYLEFFGALSSPSELLINSEDVSLLITINLDSIRWPTLKLEKRCALGITLDLWSLPIRKLTLTSGAETEQNFKISFMYLTFLYKYENIRVYFKYNKIINNVWNSNLNPSNSNLR